MQNCRDNDSLKEDGKHSAGRTTGRMLCFKVCIIYILVEKICSRWPVSYWQWIRKTASVVKPIYVWCISQFQQPEMGNLLVMLGFLGMPTEFNTVRYVRCHIYPFQSNEVDDATYWISGKSHGNTWGWQLSECILGSSTSRSSALCVLIVD